MNICPFCKAEMRLRRRKAVHFIEEDRFPVYVSHELWKCPICSFVATFDKPISKEEYDALLKERPSAKTIKERLELLGYL